MNVQNDKISDDFKLIAIRPLKGCDIRFLKNLKEGVVYKFYQNYSFKDNEGKEILSENGNLDGLTVKVDTYIDGFEDLYSFGRDIKINVSAVVGENGSGKSTLVDFFNFIIYYISAYQIGSISNSKNSTLNRFRTINKLSIEYLNALRKISPSLVFDDFQFDENADFGRLDGPALIDISAKVQSIFERNYFHRIKGLMGLTPEEELRLTGFCWRYIREFKENEFFSGMPFLPQSTETVLSFLNENLVDSHIRLMRDLQNEINFENDLREKFNYQLFYESKGEIKTIYKIHSEVSEIKKESLFYTIHLNYSLHSLNTVDLGGWINNLFHKNDGYQTPIVINPIRHDGIIDINQERKLSVDRITYNIIDQLNHSGSAELLSKYKFLNFRLKLDSNKSNRISFQKLQQESDIHKKEEFIKSIAANPFYLSDGKIIQDFTVGYLTKKFQKISNTYMRHFYRYEAKPDLNFIETIDDYEKWSSEKAIEYVLNQNNHVTRKFNQAYNFLANYEMLKENLQFLQSWDINEEIVLSSKEVVQWINFVKIHVLKIVQEPASTEDIFLQLFPAVFNVDVEFEVEGTPIKLSDFSSGEQQYLFNLNTIVYHLNNLKSIKPVIGDQSVHKTYSQVNIILDEIELYYHPQYQKKFVKDIIDSINNIQNLGELKRFNIMFLTHSPFILSDIPITNILRLKEGAPKWSNEQTFGANIYDLLNDQFFLQDGFIGDFAQEKIEEVVEFLNLKTETVDQIKKQKNVKSIIEILGENFLREKLMDMYYSKFPNEFDKARELESLKRRIDKLEND